jgi:Tol biopolymer transport system component
LIAYNTSPADATMTGALASWGIYLYDLLSGQTFPLETGLTYARHPTWAPDGKSLYFSAFNPESGTLGIYQISLDTQEVRRVYDEKGNEIQPMVSPDGSRLMFLDFDTRDIYVMDLASGALEKIDTPKALDLGYAVWSPDGEAICFEVNINSAYTIWWIKLSDMNGRQLTEGVTELDPTVGLLSVFLPK